jgi:hypothetical protein
LKIFEHFDQSVADLVVDCNPRRFANGTSAVHQYSRPNLESGELISNINKVILAVRILQSIAKDPEQAIAGDRMHGRTVIGCHHRKVSIVS